MPDAVNARELQDKTGLNDTEAIEAAINQAYADRVGQVFIPRGEWMIGRTIHINNMQDIRIFGGGALRFVDQLPLITPDPAPSDEDEKGRYERERVAGTQMLHFYNCENILIEGLTFDGNKANQTQPPLTGHWNSGYARKYFTPVDIQKSDHVTVRRCNFRDVCTVSVSVDYSNFVDIEHSVFANSYMEAVFTIEKQGNYEPTNTNVRVVGNQIKNINYQPWSSYQTVSHKAAYGNGLLVNAHDLVVAYNNIDTVDRDGMKPCDAICNNQLIVGNIVTNCYLAGINPQAGRNIVVADNIVHDSEGSGIVVGSASSNRYTERAVVSNNVLHRLGRRNGKDGIVIGRNVTDVKVSGNEIVSVYNVASAQKKTINGSGIKLTGATGVTIEGNQIRDMAQHGIVINGISGVTPVPGDTYHSVDVTIRDNTISSVGQYSSGKSGDGKGIALLDNSYNVTVDGNRIDKAKYDGIGCGKWPLPGSNFQKPSGVTSQRVIVGNVVKNSGQDGITDEATDGTVIANNIVDGVPVKYYGYKFDASATVLNNLALNWVTGASLPKSNEVKG